MSLLTDLMEHEIQFYIMEWTRKYDAISLNTVYTTISIPIILGKIHSIGISFICTVRFDLFIEQLPFSFCNILSAGCLKDNAGFIQRM